MSTRALTTREQIDLVSVLHDLRQPLAGIRALASAPPCRADMPRQPDDLYDRLRRIDLLGQWMCELMSQTVPDSAGTEQPPHADAVQVLQDVVLAAGASYPGVLRCRVPGTALVPVDALDLRRAVGNLVDNAARAAGPSGWVHARVRRTRRRVCVEVEDSGPGFGRVPAQTGRGLRVARVVVDRCGGAMEITNGRDGGALVRLRLPSLAEKPRA